MSTTVEYSSNNSGGDWWLTDAHWKALEAAGWKVKWVKDQKPGLFRRNGEDRWLGALATEATREGLSMADAIREWENITGQSSNALGCSCCGTPHSFTFTDESGKSTYWSPEFPSYGEAYS